jgi:membrane-associated phospholipid phosphatase
LPVWALWLTVTSVWCILQYLKHPRHLARIFTSDRVAGAVLAIAIVAPFQSTFQSLKRAIPTFSWDLFLSRADIAIHAGAPWTWWVPNDTVIRWIDRLYIVWFPVITLFMIWVSWTSHRQLRTRALLCTLLVWILAGTLAAWALASAGPCYYGEVVQGPDPYAPLSRRITDSGLVAGDVQRRLWEWRLTGRIAPLSGVSAMPSMHVAMAVLVALVVWRRSRPIGLVCWLYAAIVQVGSVVLGWHYAIDGYVGAFIVVVCWIISGRLMAPHTSPLSSPGGSQQLGH